MSRQSTKRDNAISKDFDDVERQAAGVVSNLVKQVAVVKILIVFLHDNLLNSKGDLTEGDRLTTRDALVPLYSQIQGALSEITELFNIHDDDVAVWQSNFNAYLAANPTLLAEALGRYPEVS